MSIIYIITDKIAGATERLTSPAHGAYGLGSLIAKVLLFAAGWQLGRWAVILFRAVF